jgi:hypothetical protein
LAAIALQNDIPHRAREAIKSLRSDADDGYDKPPILAVLVDLLFCHQPSYFFNRMANAAVHFVPDKRANHLAVDVYRFWTITFWSHHGDLKFSK